MGPAIEVRKQAAWSHERFQLFHYRDHDGLEVDIIVELPNGQLVAIEVKSSQTVTDKSWSALERFRTHHTDRKITGVVLHGGTQVAHLLGWIHVLPIPSLWEHRPALGSSRTKPSLLAVGCPGKASAKPHTQREQLR